MSSAPAEAAKVKFSSKQWLLLVGCGLGFAITGSDPAIFSANISSIRSDLELSGSQTSFIASLATLMLAATILGAGVAGDIKGKRKMFIIGALLTAVAEIGVSLSPDFVTLVIFRTLVGVGFAFLLGLSLTIVNSSFPSEQRAKAIGMYLACAFGFSAPMPAIAGIVSAQSSWRWAFVVFAIFAVITALVAWRFIEEIPLAASRRFDVPGIALAAVTLVGIVYGISKLQDGIGPGSLVPLAIGLAGAVSFVMVERRVAQPALDLRLFTRGPFNAGVAGGASFNFMTGGFTLLVSYYLVVVQGASTAVLGLLFVPAALVQAYMAGWAGRSIAKRGNRATLITGLSALIVTCLVFATLGASAPMWFVVVAFICLSIGNAITQTPEANLMMSFAPRELGGSIAGVKSGLGQAFYSLGPVIFTLIGSLYLRATGADAMDAAGVTADQVRDAMDSATSSSTGTTGGAQVLDPDQAASVTEAIREPFAHALQLTSLTIVIVPVVALILVVRLLPKRNGSAADGSAAPVAGESSSTPSTQDPT